MEEQNNEKVIQDLKNNVTILSIGLALAVFFMIILIIITAIKNDNDVAVVAESEVTAEEESETTTAKGDMSDRLEHLKDPEKKEEIRLETSSDEYRDAWHESNQLLQEYQNMFAVGTEHGNMYHKMSCFYLDNTNDLHYDTIENLEKQGYTKCDLCY